MDADVHVAPADAAVVQLVPAELKSWLPAPLVIAPTAMLVRFWAIPLLVLVVRPGAPVELRV